MTKKVKLDLSKPAARKYWEFLKRSRDKLENAGAYEVMRTSSSPYRPRRAGKPDSGDNSG